jgi:hypothetical protein
MIPFDIPIPLPDVELARLLWLIPLILVLSAFKLIQRIRFTRRRGAAGEAQVGRVLEQLFRQVRHDLILPNGRGGLTQIDHVALTPAGLLVVETKHLRGTILGQAEDATWTQALGGKRNCFQNPLRQNHAHRKAVESLRLNVPVLGRVVFTSASRFPQGLPDGVSQLHQLRDDLAHLRRGRVPAANVNAWRILLTQARTDRQARRAHRRGLRARFGWDRRARAAFVLLLLATVATGGLWWSQGGLSVAVANVQPALFGGVAILPR